MHAFVHRGNSFDVIVVGAGILGLWCALKASERGLKVALIERRAPGSGASGGTLGALMPHRPSNWTPGKALQLRGLITLESEIRRLEARTGLACHYVRQGRLMPVRTERQLEEHKRWQRAARTNWPNVTPAGRKLHWQILPRLDPEHWPELDPPPIAYSMETLSAQFDPQSLVALLAQTLGPVVQILTESTVTEICLPDTIVLDDGSRMSAGRVIVAAGVDTFSLLEPIVGAKLGWGVKGQSVLLRPQVPFPSDMPVCFDRGLYLISRHDGLVAAGSTSLRDFESADADGETTASLVQNAAALCPRLQHARLVGAWAGIRPRAVGRNPLVGQIPGAPRIIAATGGFKITFAIAHLLADAAVRAVTEAETGLPVEFTVASHLGKAMDKHTGRR